MLMETVADWVIIGFGGLIALALIALLLMYIRDVTQTSHAIRRNYPIIGRMRYTFERLGEYFRQYFFAQDREEQPFNRATRSWVYRTAKGLGGMIGFGSTNDLNMPGAHIFINSSFPKLEEEKSAMPPITIGPRTEHPFIAANVFNISGMSYGALSTPAVRALSKGAAKSAAHKFVKGVPKFKYEVPILNQCPTCIQAKQTKSSPGDHTTITAVRPYQGLSIDFSFSGVKSKNTGRRKDFVGFHGETSAIVILDHFTRQLMAGIMAADYLGLQPLLLLHISSFSLAISPKYVFLGVLALVVLLMLVLVALQLKQTTQSQAVHAIVLLD